MSNDTKTNLSLQLAESDVQRIIGEAIKAQVAAAFAARGDAIVRSLVDRFLNDKVDERGRPCHYSKTTLLDLLCIEQIKKSATEAVKEWLSENDEQLRKSIVSHLNRNKANVAKQLVASLLETAKHNYSLSVGVKLGCDPTE